MAAVLTGTPVAVAWGSSQNPSGQSITIPSDATAVYMFWAGYDFVLDDAGLASSTLNSNAPSQSFELPTNVGSPANYVGTGVCAWYNPSTGSQTLTVSWDAAFDEGPVCIVAFVAGGDTTSWRDVGADQDTGFNAVETIVATVADDLVIKFDQRYISGGGGTDPPPLTSGWTNGQTQNNQQNEGARLSYISATGTTQTCTSENESSSTICAISIPAAAGGASEGPGWMQRVF